MGRGLTREAIVVAALDTIDAEGLGKLSMRRVAGRLDVEAMSLYRHVKNKAALLDAVHDHLLRLVPAPVSAGAWEQQVVEAATAFRDVLFDHPRCVPLLATRAATTPSGLALVDAGVGRLVAAGWGEDDAVVAFQTVFCFVVGHGVFHTAGGADPRTDPWVEEEFRRGLALVVAGLRAAAPDRAEPADDQPPTSPDRR